MAKIVLATFGSLGDLHPIIALAIELKARGHEVTVAVMEYYREKIESVGLNFAPMAPHINIEEETNVAELMDAKTGPETIFNRFIFPYLRPMYDDLMAAVGGADLMLTGELIYAAKSVVEATGIKWVTSTLAPISLFSAYDPGVPPQAMWFENLRFLGVGFNQVVIKLVRIKLHGLFEPYRKFRTDLGRDPSHHPLFEGKYSDDLHLELFSRVLGRPQPDWPKASLQTGFCFYDGQADTGIMPEGLEEFLCAGEPPIVFTLGSSAVMDARDFFDESAKAAKILGRRAVLLYGRDCPPPNGLDKNVVGFEYAPYSLVFPRAACVVHQGGVGTTGQVLRAGVPHLIMPYGHDQPDNAARCRRLGVAEIISRDRYNAAGAVNLLQRILSEKGYSERAAEAGEVVRGEQGTKLACDAIEDILRK